MKITYVFILCFFVLCKVVIKGIFFSKSIIDFPPKFAKSFGRASLIDLQHVPQDFLQPACVQEPKRQLVLQQPLPARIGHGADHKSSHLPSSMWKIISNNYEKCFIAILGPQKYFRNTCYHHYTKLKRDTYLDFQRRCW